MNIQEIKNKDIKKECNDTLAQKYIRNNIISKITNVKINNYKDDSKKYVSNGWQF